MTPRQSASFRWAHADWGLHTWLCKYQVLIKNAAFIRTEHNVLISLHRSIP